MTSIADKQGAMTEAIPGDETQRATAHLYQFPPTVDENGKKQPSEYREFTDEDAKKYPRRADFKHRRSGTCGLIINERNELLLANRLGSHGAGTWAPPGGKMELEEGDDLCVVREIKEETGLTVEHVGLLGVTYDNFVTAEKGPTNWNTFWVLTKMVNTKAEPEIAEPDKCSEMKWFSVQELRDMMNDPERKEQLFLCLQNFLTKFPDWYEQCLERLGINPAK